MSKSRNGRKHIDFSCVPKQARDRIVTQGVKKCWEWQGHTSKGYGRITIKGHTYQVHRLVYHFAVERLKSNRVVRHLCHNKRCCNPHHLAMGTHRDNAIDDLKLKGRKLDVDKAREIKEALRKGVGVKALAKRYSVHRSQISRIKTGKQWEWIQAV